MKLFTYLEYLTTKEKIRAADSGQSNLKNVNTSTVKLNDKEIKFKNQKQKYLKSGEGQVGSQYILKNKFNKDFNTARVILCFDGTYYTANAWHENHDEILEYIFYDKLFADFDYNKQKLMKEWESNKSLLNKFICLTYNSEIPEKIGIADSYVYSGIFSYIIKNKKIFDHYKQLCHNKLKLELISNRIPI